MGKGESKWYDPAGFFGKPKQPTPPDPYATADAQTGSNINTAVAQSTLNNVNQVTPYGNVTFSQSPSGVSGVPQWTQTVTESDNQRDLRSIQEQQGIKLGQLGLNQTDRVSDILSTPFTPDRYSTRDDMGGKLDLSAALGGDFDASRFDPSTLGNFQDDVRARSFALATQGLGDQFDRSEESLRTRLANQGMSAGADGFGAEMSSFNRGKGNAYADALLAADTNAMQQRGQAVSELGQGYAQALGARAQGGSELLTERDVNAREGEADYGRDYAADLAQRQTPLNEITSIMSGLPMTPLNPGAAASTGINGTDIGGYIQSGYQNQLGQYQSALQQQQATQGAAAGIGAAAIAAF